MPGPHCLANWIGTRYCRQALEILEWCLVSNSKFQLAFEGMEQLLVDKIVCKFTFQIIIGDYFEEILVHNLTGC